MTATDSLVAAVVRAAASTINAAGDELKAPFHERDMQKVLAAQFDAVIAARGLDLAVKANRGIKFVEWPGVGPVDLSLLEGDGSPAAFLELKWGVGTLYNCVWDLPKMAVAVASRHAPCAYLVAGAPAADWEGGEGSELFRSQTWQAADLLDSYAKWWKFWRGDVKTHPLRLPATMSTRHVATAAMNVHGGDWQLRGVKVAAEDREWMPVHDLEQEKQDETKGSGPADRDEARAFRERMTWKPGDVEILTPEEAARRIGRPLVDLEDENEPLLTFWLDPSVRPRVKEAWELATDGELSLAEKLARIEALAREEQAEGYPAEPVLAYRDTAARIDDFLRSHKPSPEPPEGGPPP